MNSLTRLKSVLLGLFLLLAGCGGGGGGGHHSSLGTYSLTVYQSDGVTAVPGAQVDIYDALNLFVDTKTTGLTGNAAFHLVAGTYTAHIHAQGYAAVPPQGETAVPFTITARATLSTTINLDSTVDPATVAKIHGNADVANALVVADAGGGVAVSGLTDSLGDYVLYNVPVGTYTVTAFRAGYTSTSVNKTVAALDDALVDLTLTPATLPTLSGQVTFLAVTNGTVDITLMHPVTHDPIPGLSTTNDGTNLYSLAGVPAGTYLAWASFANDSYVMDPDWIDKNGGFPAALEVTVAGSNLAKDFSLTGALQLISPTNPATDMTPAIVDTLTPTFTWNAYPSAQQFVLEVLDMNGNSIWGGYTFDSGTQTSTFNHPMIGTVTSKDFNFDGSASQALQDGHTYRWRLTAFKWNTSRGGYVAISQSEDQTGVFKVQLP